MISKTEIERNLKGLQHRYRIARTQKEPLWFSKLAIIELCGWIEISLDDLALRLAKKTVMDTGHFGHINNEVIAKNYGFHYKNHFKNMLVSAIGFEGVELIEASVSVISKAHLESDLGALSRIRNALAHTYIKGVAATIDAPSVTIGRFNRIYPALKDYESAIIAY